MGQILKGEGSNLLPPLPTWVASPTRLYSYSPSPADKYLKDMPPKWIDSFRREDIPQGIIALYKSMHHPLAPFLSTTHPIPPFH